LSTPLAPSRSCTSAGWTSTASSLPSVSVMMWRLRSERGGVYSTAEFGRTRGARGARGAGEHDGRSTRGAA
jgi:hypothetical protein